MSADPNLPHWEAFQAWLSSHGRGMPPWLYDAFAAGVAHGQRQAKNEVIKLQLMLVREEKQAAALAEALKELADAERDSISSFTVKEIDALERGLKKARASLDAYQKGQGK